jgi:hypothetical protein
MEQNDATSTEETAMERNNSIRRVTPYELATLASRIDPERCATDPHEALANAHRFLSVAKSVIACAEAEEKKEEEGWEEHDKWADEKHIDWVRGIKRITVEGRRDRAEKRFTEFVEHEAPGTAKHELTVYKRDGFSEFEAHDLELRFTDWKKQPKRKKGNQGRRISEHDGRLRTQLVGLVPKKPSERS